MRALAQARRLAELLRERRATPEGRARLVIERLGLRAGEGCRFFGRCDFGSEPYLVTLGDQVMLSENVRFVTHDGGMRVLDNMGLLPKADSFGPIRVGSNVFLGMDAIVLKGVTIGDNVVVGAGAVVTRDLPGGAVYAGVPARRVRSLEEYAERATACAVPTFGMDPEEKRAFLLERYGLARASAAHDGGQPDASGTSRDGRTADGRD